MKTKPQTSAVPDKKTESLLNAVARRESVHIQAFTDFPSALISLVEEGISSFDHGQFLPKLRVFHDFGERTDFLSRLILSPKRQAEPVPEWVNRILGIKEFCLAINGMSAWNDRLHDMVFDIFVEPFVGRFGVPLKPFDVYLFCGTYPLTPFGVHSDSEDSILLHLGPNTKEAFVWPGDIYDRIVRGTERRVNLFDVDKISHEAMHIKLRPGDVLYIPKRVHHVMANGKFSYTLGFIPNPVSSAQVLPLLAREAAEGLDEADCSFLPGLNGSSWHPMLETVAQIFSLDELRHAAARLLARSRSNGYLAPAPAHLRTCGGEGIYARTLRYPLEYLRDGNWLRLFVRGRELKLPALDDLRAAFDMFRTGERLSLSGFVSMTSRSLEAAAAIAILRRLVELGGIEESCIDFA